VQAHLLATPVVLSSDTVVRSVGEETVLLNLQTEQYYVLNDVGSRVLHHLTSGATPAEAIERLAEEYDVGRDRLQRDVERVIEDLLAAALVEFRP